MTSWLAVDPCTIPHSRLRTVASPISTVSDHRSSQLTLTAAYLALTTAAMVWGGSIVVQKYALRYFSPIEVSVLRGAGALLILVPLWWWQERRAVTFTARDVAVLAALSLGVLGNHILTLFGLRYIGAGAAGIIIGASPVITALLSSLFIRDVPLRSVIGGCAVSFVGVALIAGAEQTNVGDAPWLGGMLILMGLVSWALYTIGSRRLMERFSPLTVNWTTLAFSLIPQLALLGLDQKAQVYGFDSVPVSGWLALCYLMLFATALGQQAWLYGVKGVGPSRAGVFVNLIPVSALALSALILNEPLGPREITGIGLILAGVWLVNYQSRR
jgi:drug/metabolite transporter (DMT)-like permease